MSWRASEPGAARAVAREWAESWYVPLCAAVGLAGWGMLTYTSGILLEPMTRELGWTRADYYSAITASALVGMVMMPLTGRLVDRFGSRRIALFGIVAYACGVSCLSLVGPPLWQWWSLYLVAAVLGSFVTATVWIRPVVGRFDRGRGLAMAVALSGNGLGTALWPLVGSWSVQHVGWRLTFPGIAWTWAAIMVPLALVGFRDRREQDGRPPVPSPPMRLVWPVLRSRGFVLLACAGGLLSVAIFGLTLNFVPILRSAGLDFDAAVAAAALIGIGAIAGRLATGAMLDRFSASAVGAVVFSLPALVCLLLWIEGGAAASFAASLILGLASGAEVDVIAYVAAKRFDGRIFGTLFGFLIAVLNVGLALGPLIAGAVFDRYRSYDGFLGFAAVAALASAALVIALRVRRDEGPALADPAGRQDV